MQASARGGGQGLSGRNSFFYVLPLIASEKIERHKQVPASPASTNRSDIKHIKVQVFFNSFFIYIHVARNSFLYDISNIKRGRTNIDCYFNL